MVGQFIKFNLLIAITLLVLAFIALAWLKPGSPYFIVDIFAILIVLAFLALVIFVAKKLLARMAPPS